jgi:predicted Holliday junction resolvase-like endonuclease
LEVWLGLSLVMLVLAQGVIRFRKLGRSLKRRGKAKSLWTMIFNLRRKSKREVEVEEIGRFAGGLGGAGVGVMRRIPERAWNEGEIKARFDAWEDSSDQSGAQSFGEGSEYHILNFEEIKFEIPKETAGRF